MKVCVWIQTVAIKDAQNYVLVLTGVMSMLWRIDPGGAFASLASFIQVEKNTAQELVLLSFLVLLLMV
jgi:hypothetical protein